MPISLDNVYKEVPLEKRICVHCGLKIQRNVFILDGKLYHFGCFKKSKALPTYRCQNCYGFLTKAGLNKIDFGDGSKPQLSCSNCGSSDIKHIDRWWAEKNLR
jgi:ribosomal protein S27AE